MRLATPLLVVALIAGSASATTHIVTQSGFTFSPASITVAPGDTVRWVRTGSSHTVTSGTLCTPDGIFDGVLNATITTFEWVVPESLAGASVPYFCNPHCIAAMTGTIEISLPQNPADLNGDGAVNASDLAMLLSAWGAKGPGDLNGNGAVDASDLATLLGAWTG